MNSLTIQICHETPLYHTQIEKLADEAFGPGRFVRSAFRLREGVPAETGLSFIALASATDGELELAGSIRLTRILISDKEALLLGPLVVSPDHKNQGIGRELMNRAIVAAALQTHSLVILVGDLSYYGKFGFQKVPHGRIVLPGPTDPDRLLYLPLKPEVEKGFCGFARRIGS